LFYYKIGSITSRDPGFPRGLNVGVKPEGALFSEKKRAMPPRRLAQRGVGARFAPAPAHVVAWVSSLGTSMTISAFVEEVGALVGSLTVQLGSKGHSHLEAPLSASDKRGLREEAEDAPTAPGGVLVIVVRRFAPRGPGGFFAGLAALAGGGGGGGGSGGGGGGGCACGAPGGGGGVFVRNYAVVAGGVVRLRVDEVKKMQNTDPETGEYMGDEPGVTYE